MYVLNLMVRVVIMGYAGKENASTCGRVETCQFAKKALWKMQIRKMSTCMLQYSIHASHAMDSVQLTSCDAVGLSTSVHNGKQEQIKEIQRS